MTFWNQLRVPFLAIVLGGTWSALAWGMLKPNTSQTDDSSPQLASFTFPEQVPLSGWQQVNIQETNSSATEKLVSKTFITDQLYRYERDNVSLDIEMHYMQVPKGDVNHLIGRHTVLPPTLEVHQLEGKGAYGLLQHQQKLYLTSCINPQGNSTVTNRQYALNKAFNEVRLQRLGNWLLGKEGLIDQRCLWTIMSLSMENAIEEEKIHLILKESWTSWFNWWQSRFPEG